jgi:hypothetical protein
VDKRGHDRCNFDQFVAVVGLCGDVRRLHDIACWIFQKVALRALELAVLPRSVLQLLRSCDAADALALLHVTDSPAPAPPLPLVLSASVTHQAWVLLRKICSSPCCANCRSLSHPSSFGCTGSAGV